MCLLFFPTVNIAYVLFLEYTTGDTVKINPSWRPLPCSCLHDRCCWSILSGCDSCWLVHTALTDTVPFLPELLHEAPGNKVVGWMHGALSPPALTDRHLFTTAAWISRLIEMGMWGSWFRQIPGCVLEQEATSNRPENCETAAAQTFYVANTWNELGSVFRVDCGSLSLALV